MYKRLAEVRADEDVDLLRAELVDRYGEPPEEVASLLFVARFRARARQAGIGEVTIAGKYVRFAPVSLPESRVVRLQRLYPEVDRQGAGRDDPGAAAADGGGRRASRSPGIALLEWARQVIDAVIDPPETRRAEVQPTARRGTTHCADAVVALPARSVTVAATV